MAEKDTTEKILEDYNDVFADIINVLVFNGKKKIKPESLYNTSVHSQYKADDGHMHEMERDVVKNWVEKNCSVNIAVCGIENQTKVEELMPLRIFGYEGATYRNQVSKIRSDKYQTWSHPVPVITIILYFGEGHWNKSKNLKSLLNIPEGLEEYVNDININVFEIPWLTDEQVNMFTSDFGIVAKFFVEKRKDPDYVPDDIREIEHVDEVLKLLSVMTHDFRYFDLQKDIEGRRIHNMCDVAERLENKGAAKKADEMIRKMLRRGDSIEDIAYISGESNEYIRKIESEMLQGR